MSSALYDATLNVRGDGQSPIPVKVTIGDKLFLVAVAGLGVLLLNLAAKGKKGGSV